MDIPLIDLGGRLDAADSRAPAVARALGDALGSVGFAYLAGHTVAPATRAAAFAASREFHAASDAQKRSVAINAQHRGYMGLATSTIRTSSVAAVTRPNLSESLMLMHELPADDPGLLAGLPLQGPNQWPAWLPGFKGAIERYIADPSHQSAALDRPTIQAELTTQRAALQQYRDRVTNIRRMIGAARSQIGPGDPRYAHDVEMRAQLRDLVARGLIRA